MTATSALHVLPPLSIVPDAEDTPKRTQKTKAAGNGAGSVFYVASAKRWRACLTWHDESGQQHRKSRDKVTQKEAQSALRSLFKEREDATPKSSMKLAAWLVIWLEDQRPHVRPTTHKRYASLIEHQMTSLGERSLSSITTRDVERHLDGLVASGYSTATTQGVRNVISSAFKAARRAGLVAHDPVTDARSISRVRSEVPILTVEETERLRLAAIEDHVVGPVVVMLLASGCRAGEAFALQVEDIDLDRGRVRIDKTLTPFGVGATKSSKGRRTVTLPQWATDALRDHIGRLSGSEVPCRPSDVLFTDPGSGQPWKAGTFRDQFRRLCRTAGVPMVRVHALRHGHISHLLAAGGDLFAISRRAGHASLTITTGTYGHVIDGADEALAGLL